MNKHLKQARRELGIPAFEHECRLTRFGNRMCKAYTVPGTQEAGRHSMLMYVAFARSVYCTNEEKTNE